jgi:hypothetical protein
MWPYLNVPLQSVPKTFWQISPNSILEEFFSIWLIKFYANFTNPNQFLLDRGIGLVVFSADCLVRSHKTGLTVLENLLVQIKFLILFLYSSNF